MNFHCGDDTADEVWPRLPRFIHLQLHFLIALYATTAVFGHLITLDAVALVFWRCLLAAFGAGLVVCFVLRQKLLPPPGGLLPLLGIGALIGLHLICFFGAIKLANISICLAGLATMSFFTAFTEPWLEKRRVRPLEVLLGMFVLTGILLVAGFERGHMAGLAVALLAAMLAALFPVMNRRIICRGEMHPMVMVTWEMVGASIVCAVALPFTSAGFHGLFSLHGHDWLWLLLLAWACTVFAHALHIRLLRNLSAYSMNLAANFEPIYGMAAAALLFGEHRQLHPGFYWGAAAILMANIAHPLILRRIAVSKSALLRR